MRICQPSLQTKLGVTKHVSGMTAEAARCKVLLCCMQIAGWLAMQSHVLLQQRCHSRCISPCEPQKQLGILGQQSWAVVLPDSLGAPV